MSKTNNLYAEQVINESPFFYDENGRLRVHVLSEAIGLGLMPPLKKNDEDPEETKTRREYEAQKGPRRQTDMPGPAERARRNQKDEEGYQKFKKEKAAKKPMAPVEKTPPPDDEPAFNMRVVRATKDGVSGYYTDSSRRNFVPTDMKKEKTPEQKVERKEIKKDAKAEIRADRSKEQITPDIKQKSAARVDAIRTELRNLKKTDPEAYKARIDKVKQSIAARKDAKAIPVPAKKPADGEMMRTADMQDRNLDGTDDRDQKPTGGLKKLPKPGMREKKALRSFRFSRGSTVGAGKNTNTRAGLRGVKSADRAMMEDSRPATDYIEEKMNLKTSEMGDVIKDFQKSDAPQFKGKSKEKRRIMAIAAKLQAERGE